MQQEIILVTLSYLLGSIPTGLLLAKALGGVDVRTSGSGNIGATNVYRTAGKGAGIATLVLDCLKGLLPVLAARQLGFSPEAAVLAGGASVTGHCFPLYLGFRGGKGVATALGYFLGIAPLAVALATAVFLVTVFSSRYVSLGSILAALAMPAATAATGNGIPTVAAAAAVALLIIFKHRDNIRRLREGTENRFKG